MSISIVSLFENRFFVICEFPGKNTWEYLRKFWLLAHYAGDIIALIPVALLVPDQETAVKVIYQV